jgi:hypothetical protein
VKKKKRGLRLSYRRTNIRIVPRLKKKGKLLRRKRKKMERKNEFDKN